MVKAMPPPATSAGDSASARMARHTYMSAMVLLDCTGHTQKMTI